MDVGQYNTAKDQFKPATAGFDRVLSQHTPPREYGDLTSAVEYGTSQVKNGPIGDFYAVYEQNNKFYVFAENNITQLSNVQPVDGVIDGDQAIYDALVQTQRRADLYLGEGNQFRGATIKVETITDGEANVGGTLRNVIPNSDGDLIFHDDLIIVR
jgi:hypothetical protein